MTQTPGMFGLSGGTIDPQFTIQNNADLNGILDNDPAPFTGNSWAEQMMNWPAPSEFPFPQQSQFNVQPFGIPPQATSFIPGNVMMGLERSSSQQSSNAGFFGQTAAPSALIDTASPNYNTRQATGSSTQKREPEPANSNEGSADAPPKKPRKSRKKRNKNMTEQEAQEKRKKFLDRNKVAAHKCRLRKKEWTDNLQSRATIHQQENEMLLHNFQVKEAEVNLLKDAIKKLLFTPPDGHTCDYARLVEQFQKFEEESKMRHQERTQYYLEKQRAERNDIAASNGNEQYGEMSRRSSMQSNQSGNSNFPQPSRERHDSGVSVGGTPEDSSKIQGTPKALDEAVDLGNGQGFFGHMPNQRLTAWPAGPTAGPADLVHPAVYLGLSH